MTQMLLSILENTSNSAETPQPIIPNRRTGPVRENDLADNDFVEWIDCCHLRTYHRSRGY